MTQLHDDLRDRTGQIAQVKSALDVEEQHIRNLLKLYDAPPLVTRMVKIVANEKAATKKLESNDKRQSETQRAITICLELIKKTGAVVHTNDVVKALKAEGYIANIGNIYAALSAEVKKLSGRRIKRVAAGTYDATPQGSKPVPVQPPSMDEFNQKVQEAKTKERPS